MLPGLLTDLPRDEDFRVWVAACATGEEAYSLGILIHEQTEALGRPIKVKIFASDVHRASLDQASSGIYSETQLLDVSPERRQRYFVRKGDGYQVAPELRRMVVFAPHNLIKDAPFTKLDLITCRNLLIYFQPPMQRKVLSLFHFGLKPNGVLFLGPSESPGELADEFVTLHAHWKMYKKRRDIRLPAELRLPLSAAPAWGAGSPTPPSTCSDRATSRCSACTTPCWTSSCRRACSSTNATNSSRPSPGPIATSTSRKVGFPRTSSTWSIPSCGSYSAAPCRASSTTERP